MKKIKWLLWVLLCIVIITIGIFLYLENSQQAVLSLKFLSLESPSFSLYTWLLIGFSFGVLLAGLLNVWLLLRFKMKVRLLQKTVQSKHDEIQKLRVNAIKD